MNTTPKPSQIVLMVSGAITFLFSFFSFFSYDGESWNAWNGDVGTMFMATWPALFGLIVAGLVAATAFGNVKLPEQLLTFNWSQVYLILSFTSFVILFGYLLGGGIPDFGSSPDKGIGFIFMLLGSAGLLAGSLMELLGSSVGGTSTGGTQASGGPNTPF